MLIGWILPLICLLFKYAWVNGLGHNLLRPMVLELKVGLWRGKKNVWKLSAVAAMGALIAGAFIVRINECAHSLAPISSCCFSHFSAVRSMSLLSLLAPEQSENPNMKL